ncbi:MAG: gamma-glutamyltransferase family protein [Dehalococcoidia bacterium]
MPEPTPTPLHTTEILPLAAPAATELQMSVRGPVYGRRGAVAAGQPIATTIGLDVLRAGGNAIDAALAVSAAMAVVQPQSSQLGGDAFVQVRTADGQTVALNAGGRAPMAATPDQYPDGVPLSGARAVAVPGLVDTWCALQERFATRPLAELLAPAVSLARDGFPTTRSLSLSLRGAEHALGADEGCREAFLRGAAPKAGATFQQPELARTLEAIGAGGREAFYGGETGARIVATMNRLGGLIAKEDLERNQAVWGESLRTTYRDWTVYEQPLPSQGYMTLEALNIIEGLGLGDALTSSRTVHLVAEAIRLAFLDRHACAGDPDFAEMPVERILSKEHAAELRARIDGNAAGPAVATHGGHTTSFAVADGDGNLVTFIQSVFAPWGARVVVPDTGVLLNNRMTGFSLDPASPNALRPGKRTVHTLNTWILERDGTVYAGGTPRADFQVQTNVQVIMGLVDWRLNPQWAIDAPKWVLLPRGELGIEPRFPRETLLELAARGHRIVELPAWALTACDHQMVGRAADGALLAASDSRGEGAALAW